MRLHARRLAILGSVLWLSVTGYGEMLGGAPNSACYPYLGCDAGFFGYDALEHFLFGLGVIWLMVWFFDSYRRFSLMQGEYWKSAIVLLSLVALIAVIWEGGECFRDAYLLDIAHQPLLNLRLHINYLAQPSNFDTMGDLFFTLLGASISTAILSV